MNLLAHLTIENGIRKEQTLAEHCVRTAEYAAESLKAANLYNTAYLAGILHDMGKATEKFNAYLESAFQGEDVARGSVNHTFAGVIYLLERYHSVIDAQSRWKCLTSEIIGYAIGSHHGIFDCVDLDESNGFVHRLEKDRKEICYEEAIENFFEQVMPQKQIDEYFYKATNEIQDFFEKVQKDLGSDKRNEVFFQVGLLCRMLLSAVIYGDRRDTCEFMNGISGIHNISESDIDWERQRNHLEHNISHFDTSSPLNQTRSIISMQCMEFSSNPTGIYRLNVPTGAGKTLCSLRYALAHAERFHKKRIIFIIPLLSILDQNAKVIRENITDKDLVLEHHSNVIHEDETGEELKKYELLAQNWSAPVIVSTMVQFLNILFTHKTAAIGRMRALCDSVIVIDEIQSLPKRVTLMFNEAMNFLSKVDICYLNGEAGSISTNHPKGIVAANYGAKLVSANDNQGYTYRGRFQTAEQAFALSYEASQKVHGALTWLAKKQGVYAGSQDKRIFICWNPAGKETPDILNLFGVMDDEQDDAENIAYKRKLRNAFKGYIEKFEDGDEVVVISLDAATTGRLSITYYNELDADVFWERVIDWGDTCNWMFLKFTEDKKAHFDLLTPSFYRITQCTFGREKGEYIDVDDRVLKEQSQRLLKCMLERQPLPLDIMQALVHRASTPLAYSKNNRERVLSTACAIIMKYYYDHGILTKGEKDYMKLDVENRDRSYLFGRLLAVLEKVERSTYDKEEGREPNAIRLQSAYVNHPMQTWKILEDVLNPYFQKLRPGSREYYRRIISEITEMLLEEDEKVLNQGLKESYLLGYYLQRAELNKKKDNKEEAENE